MGELARTLTVKYFVVGTEGLEELGQDDAADRVDGIGTNTELALSDGINIGQAQVEY